jgi:hypothetical protein
MVRALMARGILVVVVLGAVLWTASPMQAQQTAAASAVVLRTEASLASYAPSVAAGVRRRSGRAVTVGEVLEDASPRDLGPAVVGVTRIGERFRVFAIAGSGALHVTEVGSATDDAGVVRILVVALASFFEALDADSTPAATTEAPRAQAPVFETYELPLDGSALEDLAPPYRPLRLDPGFVLELHERVGYATQRDFALPAVGLTVGVCFGTWWCVVLDGDVMAPEEDHALDRGGLSYLSTTLGIGGRFLPLEAGPVRGGVGIDATTRVAQLWTSEPGLSSTAVSGGMRLLAEGSLQLAGPISLVLAGGADIAFNSVRFLWRGGAVLTEDIVTLWASLGLRIGPM